MNQDLLTEARVPLNGRLCGRCMVVATRMSANPRGRRLGMVMVAFSRRLYPTAMPIMMTPAGRGLRGDRVSVMAMVVGFRGQVMAVSVFDGGAVMVTVDDRGR